MRLLFPFFLAMMFSSVSAEPVQWGENVTGVTTGFHTSKKEVALTFDACGGSVKSSQYDAVLIDFLVKNKIPATLFINSRWIHTNPELFKALSSNPLFEIANHGTLHKPLSVNGKGAYGIHGTTSREEVLEEINGNADLIEKLTGKRPKFFRSGTAYYDDEAVQIARAHGVEIGGFSVLGDAGATFSAEKVAFQISNALPGDIILAHMNHPESGTAKGVEEGVRILQEKGYSFIRLSDVKERLKIHP